MATVQGKNMDRLHPVTLAQVQELANSRGVNIWCQSTGRTDEEQNVLYQGWIHRLPGFNPANPPGGPSRHRFIPGVLYASAVDMTPGAEAFGWDPAGPLHAPYRGGSQSYEPWHFEDPNRPSGYPAPAPTGPVYKLNDHGDGVKKLQSDLNTVVVPPFTPITVDGDFGQRTKDTVIQYQKNRNLVADGVAGPTTLNNLKGLILERLYQHRFEFNRFMNEPELKYGAKGQPVQDLQNGLLTIGQAQVGRADGVFGKNTMSAVENIERLMQGADHVDGIVDKKFWEILDFLLDNKG